MKNGQVQITVPEGQIPQIIIDANEAVKSGELEEAAQILNEDAVDEIREKLQGSGSDTTVMLALAKLLLDLDQWSRAEEWYRKICELEPHPFAYNAMADICFNQNRISESAQYRRKAVEADPDNMAYWLDFAKALMRTGKRQEGIALLRRRVEEAPAEDSAAGSILLWNLHYVPESTAEMFFREYKKWGETYLPADMARTSHPNDPDPDRRLRIAYISPDFRLNVVSKSFEPFLDGHNREDFELFGYGKVARPDKITERFKRKFDHYRDVNAMAQKEVARLVEKDQIDILIEIGGHCRDTCIGILAYKPAPIQVDYGGIDTSGMSQIDYRLTDRVMTPTHMERFYVEKSVCLDTGFFSYRPPRSSPLIGPLPARQNGYVTFGSFNNSIKINPYMMELWARVLTSNENSRFVMKFQGGSDAGMRDFYTREFERFGISADRLDIYEMFNSHFQHLELYNQVDLILDTYPFNGCITTIEGLWMGVPTVSLFGKDILVSRSGLSILKQLGLEIFAASDPDEYVAKAIAFSGELDNLEKIRAALRNMMLNSNLCNPKQYAQSLEKAYRAMWRRWCESQATGNTAASRGADARRCNDATDRAVKHQKGLSEVLSVENGQLKLNLPKGSLPEFLVRANEAIESEHLDRARELLTDEAIDSVRRLPKETPFRPAIMFVLADLLQRIGCFGEAEDLYKEVPEYQSNTTVLTQLATLCHAAGRLTEAAEYRSKASESEPNNVTVLADYALDVIRTGRVQHGIDILSTAIDKAPGDRKIRSDYLWAMHYLPDFDSQKFFDEHKKWAQIHAPISLARTAHDNDPDPRRRLRVGYVSSNLCRSTSTANFYAALDGRDRSAVEVYGYCDDLHQDKSTEQVKHRFDHFWSIRRMSDQEVVRRIHEDKVDILVNLGGGHEVANRFGVMACKPAPIQVDYGSINTTGMEQMDYRLTDNILTPSHLRRFYVEESVCLETGFFIYRPPDRSPPVGPLPARANGHVTFGSFNHNCKMNHHILRLWARIMDEIENSHLVLKFQGGNDRGVQDYYLGILQQFGVSRDRVRFYGVLDSHFEHLRLLNQVDIVLDTYPFNGCMTTLECLWMGVPPISLVGDKSLLSRTGLSILTHVGLQIFAASTPEQYVAKAVAFAKEPDNIEKIRATLRQQMLASDLCDPCRYARCLETAYRRMWHQWCRSQGVDVPDDEPKLRRSETKQDDTRTAAATADSSR
ncbi:MAG: O-linked N-acetylglucosamine transferase, SPINDLY family protein [Planctomycetota bacterium]